MSWTRVLAMASKELIQIRRDSRSLMIVLVMPITLVLLFGYGVSLDLKHLPIYVYDQDVAVRQFDLDHCAPLLRLCRVKATGPPGVGRPRLHFADGEGRFNRGP